MIKIFSIWILTLTLSVALPVSSDQVSGLSGTYAPLASPALTGTPTAPTATVGTNTTQLATTAFVLANTSSAYPSSVRQTVSFGPMASTGVPSFFSSSSASLNITSINISSTVPLVVTSANGNSAAGDVNAVGVSTSNLTWSGLPASSTVYLYVTISGGVLTPGFTTVAPAYLYGNSFTPSTASGAFTFLVNQMIGYMGNGTTASQANVVFLGQCVTGASTTSSIIAYVYQGRYVAPWTATLPAAAALVTVSDNIGTREKAGVFEILNTTADGGYSVGDVTTPASNAGAAYMPVNFQLQTNSSNVRIGASSNFLLFNQGTGAAATPTAADWSYRVRVTRNF